MIYLESFLSLALLSVTSLLLIRRFRANNLSESVLLFFLFSTAQISLLGYAVSWSKKLDSLDHWCVAGLALFVAVFLFEWFFKPAASPLSGMEQGRESAKSFLLANFTRIGKFRVFLLVLLFATAVGCALLNLALVVFTTPSSYDSLVYWIARIGYFLQQGSLDYFEATMFWDAHRPKIQTILLTYIYLLSGRNENLFQLVNYLAYWIMVCSVYYLVRNLGLSVARSCFAALIFSLLIDPLLLSAIEQNDILLFTYSGLAAGFCFAFQNTRARKYLLTMAVSLALGFNVKESFVFCVPALSIVVLYTIYPSKESGLKGAEAWIAWFKSGIVLAVCLVLAVALFALPSGYWDNLLRKGHIIVVPKQQADASFTNRGTTSEYLKESAVNVLRYSVDFINLDGLPSQVAQKTHDSIRSFTVYLIEKTGVDLTRHFGTYSGQDFFKVHGPNSHPQSAFWGILGFMFVWPLVILQALGAFKNRTSAYRGFRVLSFAAIFYFLTICFGAIYDNGWGRYFTLSAVLAVPLTAPAFDWKNRLGRLFLAIVVILGCASAFLAILLRTNSPMIDFGGNSSIFSRDRYEQLTRDWLPEKISPVFRKYEKLVPMNATVAQWVGVPPLEYLYFGPKLLRRVLPLKFWEDEVTRVPYNADYMVFQSTETTPERGDVLLGMNIFLRKLHPPMRFVENLALPRNGGRAVVIYNGKLGMPASNLNDGTNRFLSTYDAEDVAFAIARDNPYWVRTMQVVLYEGGTLRDVSVVATDDAGLPLSQWMILRSRIAGLPVFNIKTTVPPGKDEQVVMIEIDKDDPNFAEYKVFGLASLSGSSPQYQQNYNPGKPGIAMRELMIAQENPEHFQPMLKKREAHSIKDLYVMDYEFYQGIPDVPSTETKTFKYAFINSLDGQLIKPEENLALRANGGIAGATSTQNKFSVSNLNDGGSAAWGADGARDGEDTAFFITRREALSPRTIQLVLFGAKGNTHMKDLSVVATDDLNKPLNEWVTLNAKVVGSSFPFQKKITLPAGDEESVVTIEIDPSDPNYRANKAFGVACFSKSAGYERNYIPQHGGGIYVHEILMSEKVFPLRIEK